MPRWLTRVLARIHAAAARDAIALTHKAEQEAIDLGFSVDDAIEIVASLASEQFKERLVSDRNDAWMYVFVSEVEGIRLYIKLVFRPECFVVSFHEDETGQGDE